MQRMLPQQRYASVKFQFIVMLLYMKWYTPINCGGIELNMSAIPPPPPWRGPQWLKKSFMLIGLTGIWPLDRVFSPSSYNTRQPQVNTSSVHVCLFVCSITFIGTNPATATTATPHKGQIYILVQNCMHCYSMVVEMHTTGPILIIHKDMLLQ